MKTTKKKKNPQKINIFEDMLVSLNDTVKEQAKKRKLFQNAVR